MRIAVLGWGSLVWQPRNDHGELARTGDWHEDGPLLPVEFARISSDGRMTLIVVPGYSTLSPVLWIRSSLDHLDAAIANLAERETGAPPEAIHAVAGDRVRGSVAPAIGEVVREWVAAREDLDAAVWTGLGPGPRWGPGGWSPDHAVRYLLGLQDAARARAVEYIRNAPRQIDTPVRRAIERTLYPSR